MEMNYHIKIEYTGTIPITKEDIQDSILELGDWSQKVDITSE